MDLMTILSIIMLIIGLLFSAVIFRALYRFFVKKKVPTVAYTPYDDTMKGEKKE